MEIVLDWTDVERLLRKGLAKEGIRVPPEACMVHRPNNKKQTTKLVFKIDSSGEGQEKR